MTDYIRIAIELVAGFVLLFIIAKLLGKTQISQITAFEFISALVLGELVGNAIFDEKVTIWHISFALGIWALLMYVSQLLGLRVLKLRGLFEGNPSIIVKQGRMDRKEMKKNKMSINQLQIMLREKNVFSVRDVDYAILEPTGVITVLLKDEHAAPTKGELSLPHEDVYLPINIIVDGKLIDDNLHMLGFNERWLEKQLDAQGYDKVEDIFFAEWLQGAGLHIEPLKPSHKTG